ncbi:tam [Symbiodinium sp. CCMP2592]|nr:tam [Symbiodinium sp. CCMP2592]
MSSDVHADAASSEPKTMISKEELAASYGKSAGGYESMLDQEVVDKKVLYDKIVDMLLSGLGELEGPVADVSCGPGHVLAMLKERQKERPLMGSDLCQDMVDRAAKRLPDAKFQRADMTDLSGAFKDAELAGMINMFALHHVDEMGVKAALAEASRVLRGSGCLLLAFWEGPTHGAQMPSAPKDSDTHGRIQVSARPSRQPIGLSDCEEWGAAHLWSTAGMYALAAAAGFDPVSEHQELEKEFDMNMAFLCLKKRS